MRVVVDSSAMLAILLNEPERSRFAALLLSSEPQISAATLIETLRVVQTARGPNLLAGVHELLAMYRIEIVAVDADQVRFGKGRGRPPAKLNFGDLFAYALARQLDAPLLYKGEDFVGTDVRPANA